MKGCLVSQGSPSHWRVRRNRLGVGAFDGVSAVIYGKLSTPENDTIKRIITSGGGRVIKMSPPFDSVCGPAGANLAIIGDSKDKDADRCVVGVLTIHLTSKSSSYDSTYECGGVLHCMGLVLWGSSHLLCCFTWVLKKYCLCLSGTLKL